MKHKFVYKKYIIIKCIVSQTKCMHNNSLLFLLKLFVSVQIKCLKQVFRSSSEDLGLFGNPPG